MVDQNILSSVRLPQFFPLVTKDCEETSKELFRCLNEKTKELEDQEMAVSESLTLCVDYIQSYSNCMEDHYKKEEKRNNKRFFGFF